MCVCFPKVKAKERVDKNEVSLSAPRCLTLIIPDFSQTKWQCIWAKISLNDAPQWELLLNKIEPTESKRDDQKNEDATQYEEPILTKLTVGKQFLVGILAFNVLN